jgi:RNA polymerase sigma factor (TIGR02999 family)
MVQHGASQKEDITQLLVLWKNGDEHALVRLLPIVYRELRTLARSYLRHERSNHTLQPTALVHELFIRFATQGLTDFTDRAHFFGVAARAMRQILVTHARRHDAVKRGGAVETVPYDSVAEPAVAGGIDLAALDHALSRLAATDPLQARIVELRFFGGYTIKETAALAGCSPATVSREWELARIWLYREMRGGTGDA